MNEKSPPPLRSNWINIKEWTSSNQDCISNLDELISLLEKMGTPMHGLSYDQITLVVYLKKLMINSKVIICLFFLLSFPGKRSYTEKRWRWLFQACGRTSLFLLHKPFTWPRSTCVPYRMLCETWKLSFTSLVIIDTNF